ncbi:MAG: hypothetical protein IJM87_02975 [Ruminococcus sp.]|nr:hypothetical protein [Ruminococcus sp.]
MALFGETYEVAYTKKGINFVVEIRATSLQKAKEKFGKKYGLCDNVKFKVK